MRFVETPIFTRVIERLVGDEDYRGLANRAHAAAGAGSGHSCRRWPPKAALGAAKGREAWWLAGDLLWAPVEAAFYILFAYAMNEHGDLTPAQTRALGQLVREEFK